MQDSLADVQPSVFPRPFNRSTDCTWVAPFVDCTVKQQEQSACCTDGQAEHSMSRSQMLYSQIEHCYP